MLDQESLQVQNVSESEIRISQHKGSSQFMAGRIEPPKNHIHISWENLSYIVKCKVPSASNPKKLIKGEKTII